MTYFEFLTTKVAPNPVQRRDYITLLHILFDEPFHYTNEMDSNRYDDGLSMRDSFLYHNLDELYSHEVEDFQYWSRNAECSWLEAMVALAIRCEEIMSEPGIDHTSKWFWVMIDSMGLGDQTDGCIDIYYIGECLMRVTNCDYSHDGRGGMFYVPGTNLDMKCEEIWTQAMEYLNQFN